MTASASCQLGKSIWLLASVLACLQPDLAAGESASADSDWVRLHANDSGEPLALQTAIGRYEGRFDGAPVVVDLVGAVHVGDRAYYRALNRRFKQYDTVLYELVAPPGASVRRGAAVANDNPLGAMQNSMKSVLALEHQLERIDYTRANFVHADMSPTELLVSMTERYEGFLKLYFRLKGRSIAMQSEQTARGKSMEIDLFKAMVSDDRERQMKIVMAEQMANVEGFLEGLGGEQGSTLIEERNLIALEGLRKELNRGKRRAAVFYGAGHLSDMHTRLLRNFGLSQSSKEWLDAWDLRP